MNPKWFYGLLTGLVWLLAGLMFIWVVWVALACTNGTEYCELLLGF